MLHRSAYLTTLVCLVYVITVCCVSAQDDQIPDEKKVEDALKLVERLTETRKGLNALKKIIADIDSDLQKTEKRTCALGGGMNGHCTAAFLNNKLHMQDWLKSGLSPGRKRAIQSETPEMRQLVSRFQDLTRKRKGLQILQRILNQMEADLMYEQKRNCHFNLGGHCATESAAYVADHWHYLNSPLSPGRKRRDTGLYKKLISGKVFQ